MADDVSDRYDAPKDDQPQNEREFVRDWLEAIALNEKEEDAWRKTAERANDAYRGGDQAGNKAADLNTFNIYHSNVETLVPALYNSTPIPDVRRRYNDEDPAGKDVAELFERAIGHQLDAYDFDATMLSAVKDMVIASRGIARVRYEPTFDSDQKEVLYEKTSCEHVPWRLFRRGPGQRWDDVPWTGFELYLSHDEVKRLVADESAQAKSDIKENLKFSYSAEPKKEAEQQGENLSRIAQRARVFEIWDKDNRRVHFISPDYSARRLATLDDPLKLTDFYCHPRPLCAISSPDSLIPITLLQVYEALLRELNIVQERIIRLTAQLRARGGYAGTDNSIAEINNADDGEIIPLKGMEMFVSQGVGLDKAIWFWPLEVIANVITQLTAQREQIKAAIYEVTGLSDIIRGATVANETATAQQLKSNWGSIRIQRMQAEVARFARDLFRLKAEIMANKFSMETMLAITGMRFPTVQEKQLVQQQMMLAQQQQMAQQQSPPGPGMAQVARPTPQAQPGMSPPAGAMNGRGPTGPMAGPMQGRVMPPVVAQ